MSLQPQCPQCGAILDRAVAEGGICPRCLLQMAMRPGGPLDARDRGDEDEGSAAGQTYGAYRIVRLLGEGGMGTVYLAEQRQPISRLVALKVIKLGMDTREVIARFESERQALALMDHPNIAKVLDAGATPEGTPYFVMEYVPGVPITEYCDKNRMSNRQRLELFAQVCQAVQHAHQKGIIHRDIKPSNVLVWLQDEKPVPKVIDFGVAKAVDRRLTEHSVFTEWGILIGTPEYMSPEQAQMSGVDVDTTTDIYSLGVLLYQLLCGVLPFDSRSLRRQAYDEIRRMIREEEPPRPSARFSSLGAAAADVAQQRQTDVAGLERDLRGDLNWITMKAMAKDRARRYASASEFAADIARHLRDEPVMASPPSTSYRFGKFIRKHRGPVLALAAVFLSLLLGLGASTVLYFRAERQRQEAQAQRAEAERQRAEAVRQRVAADRERAEASRQGQRAEQQRTLAEQSRMTADQQRKEAELQHAEADRERKVAEQQTAEARRRGAEAVEQRSAAEKQREVAERQSRAADEQRAAAERQRLVAQRQGYAANLIAADLHIRSNEIAEARRRLFLCPPDLRGWEWRYLLWKSDTSLATLAGPGGIAQGSKPALGFSPDSTHIFRTYADTMYWWPAAGHTLLANYRNMGTVLAADREGLRIVSASSSGDHSLCVFDAASSRVLSTLAGPQSDAACAAFNRTGTRVVSGARDGTIRMWDTASGRLLAKLDGHKGGVWAVAFSADGERLVSAGEDRMVRVWDAGSGHPMYAIAGHGAPVLAATFSPDRRTIVSGSADKTVRIWDAATGRPLHTLTGHGCAVQAVAISPDGATIASASCSTLRLWDTASGKLAAALGAEWRSEIATAAFSPDGMRVAAAGTLGEVKVWNAPTYGGGILKRAEDDIDRAVPSPGGALLALHHAKTKSFEVWDARQRKTAWALPGNYGQAAALAFSPDSSRLATVSADNSVCLWNAATGHRVAGPVKLPAPVTALAFSADGARLVSGSSDRAVSLWDSVTMKRLFSAALDTGAVRIAIPSPDGKHIAAAAGDRTLAIWDIAKPDAALKLNLPAGLGNIVSAAYSPDGRRIAGGAGGSGDIGVWDTGTGQLLTVLKGHSAPVEALAFSPDGSRLVSGSRDQTLRIWDAATYDPLLVMGDHDEAITSVVFSPDGSRIDSTSSEGTARIWDTRTPADAKQAREARP